MITTTTLRILLILLSMGMYVFTNHRITPTTTRTIKIVRIGIIFFLSLKQRSCLLLFLLLHNTFNNLHHSHIDCFIFMQDKKVSGILNYCTLFVAITAKLSDCQLNFTNEFTLRLSLLVSKKWIAF
jgi:hypothetical protein